MKKITLIILIVFMSLWVQEFHVSAENISTLNYGKNHLDLSNLRMTNGNDELAYTFMPIEVIANQKYTIVLDNGFLGRHADQYGNISITIQEYPTMVTHQFTMLEDGIYARGYIEFTPTTSLIHITELPMMIEGNYDAIMYRGAYTSFTGFEPFINAQEQMNFYGVLPVDYDHALSETEIMSLIHAEDPYGNPLTIDIIEDAYATSLKLPGEYEIIYAASFNNIIKYYHLEVIVFDQAPPVIDSVGSILVPLADKMTLEEILDLFTVIDNVDQMTKDNLVVTYDTYSQADTLGAYTITVEAVDSSHNVATRTITIYLVDQNGPTITGSEAIYVYTTDDPLSSAQIIDKYTIIDDIDGTNVTTVLSINQYNQTQIPGVYAVTIKASDTKLNETTKNILIHVIDNRGPIFTQEEIILSTDTAHQMTDAELIDWFINHTLSSGHSVSNVRILYNEYTEHQKETGNYYVYMNYELGGETQVSRIRVDVDQASHQINFVPFLAIGAPVLVTATTVFILKKKK